MIARAWAAAAIEVVEESPTLVSSGGAAAGVTSGAVRTAVTAGGVTADAGSTMAAGGAAFVGEILGEVSAIAEVCVAEDVSGLAFGLDGAAGVVCGVGEWTGV